MLGTLNSRIKPLIELSYSTFYDFNTRLVSLEVVAKPRFDADFERKFVFDQRRVNYNDFEAVHNNISRVFNSDVFYKRPELLNEFLGVLEDNKAQNPSVHKLVTHPEDLGSALYELLQDPELDQKELLLAARALDGIVEIPLFQPHNIPQAVDQGLLGIIKDNVAYTENQEHAIGFIKNTVSNSKRTVAGNAYITFISAFYRLCYALSERIPVAPPNLRLNFSQ